MAHSFKVNPMDLKLALISYLLSLAIFIPISGWVADKYGIKRVFIGAVLVFTLILINQNFSIYRIGFLSFIYGFLISLQYTAMNSLAYANIESDNMSAATSIMSTTQQLAQSFGVAVAAYLVHFFSSGTQLPIGLFHKVFFVLGILTWCAMIIFCQLKSKDGNELIYISPSAA